MRGNWLTRKGRKERDYYYYYYYHYDTREWEIAREGRNPLSSLTLVPKRKGQIHSWYSGGDSTKQAGTTGAPSFPIILLIHSGRVGDIVTSEYLHLWLEVSSLQLHSHQHPRPEL